MKYSLPAIACVAFACLQVQPSSAWMRGGGFAGGGRWSAAAGGGHWAAGGYGRFHSGSYGTTSNGTAARQAAAELNTLAKQVLPH